MNYLVTAYRWGCTNLHQYQVYCGPDQTKAIALARNECEDRGGKYGCAVYKFDDDGTQHELIEYFNAMMHNEENPFHNHKIDFYERLGHIFARYAEGYSTHVEDDDTLKDLKGIPIKVIKNHPTDVPEWVMLEYKRAEELYDIMKGI